MNKYAHLLKTNEAVISNFENIKAMTKQELADFLSSCKIQNLGIPHYAEVVGDGKCVLGYIGIEDGIEDGRKYGDEYSISFSMFCLFRDALMFKSKEDALDFWERHKSHFIHKDLMWAEIVEVNLEDKGSLYEREK